MAIVRQRCGENVVPSIPRLWSPLNELFVLILSHWINFYRLMHIPSTMFEDCANVEGPPGVDFIVVGGGQSGLVVASRLSEDPRKTVLVIEAGSNRKGDPRIDTPGMMTSLYDDPEYDWKHRTTPQVNINNRSIAWPRGKVLGGTSAMNFSALVYPAKSDFDNWALLLDDEGWNSENMARYIQKPHKYEKPHAELKKRMMMGWVDEEAQGYDGPLAASFTNELGPFVSHYSLKLLDARGFRFTQTILDTSFSCALTTFSIRLRLTLCRMKHL